MFLLTDFDSNFLFKNVWHSQDIHGIRFNAHAIIDSETDVLLKSLFMNILRNVATIRRTSCMRYK